MQHKTLAGPHGVTHYWVDGAGDQTIVFTHGATMDHGLFQYQLSHFAPRYKIINWDVPLHGLSRPYTQFSLHAAAHELLRILAAENVEHAHLVGQSMGGFISQLAAFDQPERVSSLVAVDSSPVQLAYYSRLDRWLLGLTPSLLKLYPYDYLIKITANQIALSEAARAYALVTLKSYTKSEIVQIMGAVYGGLVQSGEAVVRCPVLIVYGEHDRTGKVRSYCDRWAAQEKHPLKIIANAAHNANMDNPTEFNRVLEEFLARH
jgi:pimeloyl-ACP methyl ester carboxylesterase